MKWIPFNPDWQPSPEVSPRGPAAPPAQTSAGPTTCKVVVAEDDAGSREVVWSLLRSWDFDVLVTRDGVEAMEALRAQTAPTLAVLDWMMPGMDGI